MSKAWKITISVVSSILALILIFLSVYYFWPWNKEFFAVASQEFAIPGLDTQFVPQGFTLIEDYPAETDKYLVCGYMNDGSPSRYYLIDAESGSVDKYFTLEIQEDDADVAVPYTGHAGGVASYGSTLWTVSKVGDSGYCFRFLLSDIVNVPNGSAVAIRDCFITYNNADFVFVNNKMLWVGEFYKSGKYETNADHHKITRSGEENRAMMYGFEIDESYKYGLLYNEVFPAKAISIPNQVQGVAVTKEGNFILSTSYSLPDSCLYYYKDVLNEPEHGKTNIGPKRISLWYLDNESLLMSVNAPAMSEELVINNDRLYILFESACKKYKIFNRKQLKNVYSLPLTHFQVEKN